MAGIILNLFNPFIQMFAKRMGAQDIHIALLNSLPPLVAIFVLIPCSILLDRINNKKFVTGLMILLNSLFYVAIAFVPFIPDNIKVIVYVLLIGLMNWPGSLSVTTWQSFFAGTFTGSEADLVFSARSKYNAFFGLLTVLLTGYVLTSIPKSEEQRIILYQIFYVACFLFSILQVLFLAQVNPGSKTQEMDKSEDKPRFNLKEFKEIFSNREFVILCLCTFAFHVAWQIGWPLFFIYNVDYIKIGEFQMSIISVGSGLVSFLSYSLWNRIVKKKGNSFVIIICTFGLAVTPLCYSVLIPYYFVVLVQALGGAFSAGFSLTLFCNLLEILPENKRTIYISTFNTFINISGFLSPLAGVWMYERTGIFRAMFIIGLMRVLGGLIFLWRWIWMKNRKKNGRDMMLPVSLE
jgi:MFS family permease